MRGGKFQAMITSLFLELCRDLHWWSVRGLALQCQGTGMEGDMKESSQRPPSPPDGTAFSTQLTTHLWCPPLKLPAAEFSSQDHPELYRVTI